MLTGQIPATAVATLRPGAMASAEQQAKDSQIDKDALYHGQAAQATPTEGIFQCGKCKSDKVRFALAQVSQCVRVRVRVPASLAGCAFLRFSPCSYYDSHYR